LPSTQPHRVTFSPIFSSRNSPQLWVRNNGLFLSSY
jgi:hypothetical protein